MSANQPLPSHSGAPSPSGGGPEAAPAARVLVCDHRGEGAALHARSLSAAGHTVEVSALLRHTLERLAQAPPSVALLDPLTDAGEAELAAVVRALHGAPATGLLVLTEDDGPSKALLLALRAEPGLVVDFVRRSASDDEIDVRVELLLSRLATRDELERMRHRATHDDRTDLLRPQAFQDQLRQHFSAAQRHGIDLGLLLIDLDDFGRINKQYDHTVGDEVIARVGAAIRRALRTEDIAARLGGDEFCVLLPYTRKVDAARVVQRLLEQIPESTRDVPCQPPLRVTASLGFETFDGKDLKSEEDMRRHAEEALRVAKRSGGDRGIYYRSLDAEERPAPRSADQ